MARRGSPSGLLTPRRRGWALVAIVLIALVLSLSVPAPALAADGDIYVVDPFCCGGTGGVIRVDPTTGVQTVVASGGNIRYPFGIAVAADGLYITSVDQYSPSSGRLSIGSLLRVDPGTGAQTVISSAGLLVAPSRLAPAADGTLTSWMSNVALATRVGSSESTRAGPTAATRR